jgi:hypothetical protein
MSEEGYRRPLFILVRLCTQFVLDIGSEISYHFQRIIDDSLRCRNKVSTISRNDGQTLVERLRVQ